MGALDDLRLTNQVPAGVGRDETEYVDGGVGRLFGATDELAARCVTGRWTIMSINDEHKHK